MPEINEVEATSVEQFKLYEEQDSLIANGVKIMCRKLIDLIDLCTSNDLDLDSSIVFS